MVDNRKGIWPWNTSLITFTQPVPAQKCKCKNNDDDGDDEQLV